MSLVWFKLNMSSDVPTTRCRDHADHDLLLWFPEKTHSGHGFPQHTSWSRYGIPEEQSSGVSYRRLLPMQTSPNRVCTTRFTIAHLNHPRTNYNRCRDHADHDLPLGFPENTLSSAGHTPPSGHGILEEGHDRAGNTSLGVAYRRLLPMQLWKGFTFNPGLRRVSDYQVASLIMSNVDRLVSS